ncbi:type 1 glutamine amidotransferase [Mobilicoccus pelagius]|uniref:Glutamine amidotransferase domain-containing protein n=1 Tax=Mobilicoccus pelagius NBRC 104925 TaxID=1089455 RepID=H5UQQ5_9MICO|nr:type 1 glutamine amidotransferase [Mobilicoccus pelagius]GAB48063.1 hypothetical protein MOPEL_041_00060 [Mobilicoccus pelagius NBRC 104925]
MTVLVVEHEPEAPPGRLGATSLDLHVVRPYAGDVVPDDLSDFAGFVVLGGEMGAYDDTDHPWLAPTRELVRRAAATDVPTLLVCLGHQLGAVALGGAVARNPRGPQWDVVDVGLTEEGRTDALLRHLPDGARVVHWNGDVVTDLPDGAVLLARDPRGDVQAVRYVPRMWGLQCHPEADAEIVARWGADETDPEDAARAARAIAEARSCDALLDGTWRPVLEAFARLVATNRRPSNPAPDCEVTPRPVAETLGPTTGFGAHRAVIDAPVTEAGRPTSVRRGAPAPDHVDETGDGA